MRQPPGRGGAPGLRIHRLCCCRTSRRSSGNAGRFADALPFLQETIRLSEARTFPTEDLHRLTGDTLGRLERYAEAEQHFHAGCGYFPTTCGRARTGHVYRAQGRAADADRAIETMLRLSPTPASVALAAQLWTMFGEPEKAEAARRWRSAPESRR
jgi:hypothetical protein